MGVDVEINTYFFLKGSFELSIKVFDKSSHPAVVLIVLLTIADEDIVVVTRYDTCHGTLIIG
jgi:hypothetical protein